MLLFWKRCLKLLYLFLNFLTLLLAVGVIIVGVVIKFQTELLSGYVTPLVKIIPAGGGTEQDVYVLYDGVASALMAFGGLMAIIGVVGCIVGTCSSRGCLIAYGVLMTTLLLLQLTGMALLATMNIGDKLTETLVSNFVPNYKGDKATDEYSVAWNYIMVEFDCCAVQGMSDFQFCYWDRQVTVNNVTFTVEIPVTCCKLPGGYPAYGAPVDDNCTLAPTDDNSYCNKGCRDEVDEYLDRYRLVMILTFVIAMLVQIGAAAAMLVLERAKKKNKRISPDSSYHQEAESPGGATPERKRN